MKTKNKAFSNFCKSNTFILLIVTIAVILLFFLVNHNFLSFANVQSVMLNMGFDGVLTLGAAIVLIGGEVDLSSGAVACFGGMLFGITCNAGVPWPIAFLLGLLAGIIFGLLHAFFVNELKFMSFMATLAMAEVYRGFVSLLLKNKNIQVLTPGVRVFGNNIAGIPLTFLVMVVLLVLYGVILNKRKLGREIYLVGGNRESARLCGVSPKKISYFVYINNGLLCALAGILFTARMHTASPSTGTSGETNAITAAVLGGISFMGGSGGVAGCFVGIMLLDFFNAGLTAIGFPAYWQIVAKGALLVLALGLDFFTTMREKRRLSLEV